MDKDVQYCYTNWFSLTASVIFQTLTKMYLDLNLLCDYYIS